MKIFLICSKAFYGKVPPIKNALEGLGHMITLPNSFDDPSAEKRHRELGENAHAVWKSRMLQLSAEIVKDHDAVLVLNFDKNGQQNYIGGATFLEMYEAFKFNKKIFLYNDIPEGIFFDEISSFRPILLGGNLDRVV